MGEEFYCILKLVSGEEIISLITIDETGDEAIIIAQSPLIMKIHYGPCLLYTSPSPRDS